MNKKTLINECDRNEINAQALNEERLTLNQEILEGLTSQIRGEVIMPESKTYNVRSTYNAMIDKKPALICENL